MECGSGGLGEAFSGWLGFHWQIPWASKRDGAGVVGVRLGCQIPRARPVLGNGQVGPRSSQVSLRLRE